MYSLMLLSLFYRGGEGRSCARLSNGLAHGELNSPCIRKRTVGKMSTERDPTSQPLEKRARKLEITPRKVTIWTHLPNFKVEYRELYGKVEARELFKQLEEQVRYWDTPELNQSLVYG